MIRVFFDDTEIVGDYIQNITQVVQPYNQNFILGSTICRQFDIDIRNEGFSSLPEYVYLYEDNDSESDWTKYATLLIDSSEVSNQNYRTFHLTDIMVRFNTELEYTTGNSLLTILQDICSKHNISLVNQSFYMSDFNLTWDEELQERDLIGYIAEVNSGYAYINEDGNLIIAEYSRFPADNIDINMCSSYKLGEHHLIDRVYVDFAVASRSYPETSENDTLYLNPENILITDSQNYTIENTLKHIYSIISGFEFYNIEIDKCPINPNLKAGQLIGVGNWGRLLTSDEDYITTTTGEKILVTDGLLVPFICEIDWKYNTMWLGGYRSELECSLQEETQIITTKDKFYRINFKVDRESGRISQMVSDAENHTGLFEIYLNSDEPNNVISVINAAADNIILNTKSLIFGEYPDGQYIEVNNFYSNNVATGIKFDGTGNIIFNPQEMFRIRNMSSNNNVYNSFLMNKTGTATGAFISLTNYDNNNYLQANFFELNSNYVYNNETYNRTIIRNNATITGSLYTANTLIFEGRENRNNLYIRNYKTQSNSYANVISMTSFSNDSVCSINLLNYNDSGYYANYIQLTKASSNNSFFLRNYEINSSNLASLITMNSSTSNSISINNYFDNVINNEILMTTNSSESKINLQNYNANGSILMNQLMLDNNGYFYIESYYSNYKFKIGTINDSTNTDRRHLYIGNNTIVGLSNYDPGSIIIDSTQINGAGVYINGHKLTFSNGNVGYV